MWRSISINAHVGVLHKYELNLNSLHIHAKLALCRIYTIQRCTYQGFIQRGGGPGIPPPLEILKLSMVIIVASMHCLEIKFITDCVRRNLRRNLRGSKFKIFREGGICPQTPLVATHTTIILLPFCSLPPQLKILYETLHTLYMLRFTHV